MRGLKLTFFKMIDFFLKDVPVLGKRFHKVNWGQRHKTSTHSSPGSKER